MRLAACFATEQGVEVCALIHDAMLIAAPLDQLDHDIERTKAPMLKASRVVLDGFELRTDVNVIRYPDRYQDGRMSGDEAGGKTRSGKTGGGVMDDQDEIGIERLRVDPALMAQVLEHQARKSKRKGWQQNYTQGRPPGNKGGNAMIRTGQPFDADDQMHLNLRNVHVGMSLQVDDK